MTAFDQGLIYVNHVPVECPAKLRRPRDLALFYGLRELVYAVLHLRDSFGVLRIGQEVSGQRGGLIGLARRKLVSESLIILPREQNAERHNYCERGRAGRYLRY